MKVVKVKQVKKRMTQKEHKALAHLGKNLEAILNSWRFLSVFLILTLLVSCASFGQSRFEVKDKTQAIDTAASSRLVELAVSGIAGGNLATALNYLRQATRQNPGNAKALRLKGELELRITDYDSAVESFGRAFELDRKDLRSLIGRARSLRMNGSLEKSLTDYDSAVSLGATGADVSFGRGQVEFDLGKYRECIEDMTKTYTINKDCRALFFRGSAYLFLDLYRPTIADLDKYLACDEILEEDLPYAYFRRGYAYTMLGENDRMYADSAVTDLAKARDYLPNDVVCNRIFGYANGLKGDSVLARQFISLANNLNPSDGESKYLLSVLESRWKNFGRAASLMDEAISVGMSIRMSEVYRNAAQIQLQLRDTVRALGFFSESIREDSAVQSAYYDRIKVVAGSPRFRHVALQDLTKLIELGRSQPTNARLLASYYSQRSFIYKLLKDSLAALDDAATAVAVAPDYFYPYVVRAVAKLHSDSKDVSMALEDVNKALELDNSIWESWYLKAMLLTLKGAHKREACSCAKRAVTLSNGVQSVKNGREIICKGKPVDGRSILNLTFDPRLNQLDE